MTGSADSRRRAASTFVRIAVLIGLAAPLLVFVGAFGTKFGLLEWQTGFGRVAIGWGSLAAKIGAGVGLLAVLVSFVDLRRLLPWALAALALPGLTLLGFIYLRATAAEVPPIHDVSTNWDEPPGFSDEMMLRRVEATNAVEPDPVLPADIGPPWGGRRVAEINAETCPGAVPVMRQVAPQEAARALESNGVQVIGRAPWRVEGTHESWWFGFKDDVVIRIRPGRTDVRSVSRVGRSDLGANCDRVTAIVEDLAASG